MRRISLLKIRAHKLKFIFQIIKVIWKKENSFSISIILSFIKLKLEQKVKKKKISPYHKKQINICLHLLDRLINDRYEENADSWLNSQYGESVYINKKTSVWPQYFDLKSKVLSKEQSDEFDLEMKFVYSKLDIIRKEDYKMLFKYLFKLFNNYYE